VASGGALSNLLDLQRAAGEPDNGPIMSVLTVRNWLARLSALDLEARKAVPGIAQARADILPTALATVSALAEHTGAESLQITHHGLRHGVAQLLLSDAADLLAAAPVLS
jgi:exopolyphosphatase/pppGpp-phosphohydrolase